MSVNFLITGTGRRVGKSTVGCALGFAFRARGLRIGVMKPAEVGCADHDGELEASDTRALALAAGCDLPVQLMCPYRYRSATSPPAAAQLDSLPQPELGRISDCFDSIAAASDLVLVESISGLAEPITWQSDFADLAAALDLEVIVVIANRPGAINSALLTLRYAASKGLRVAGWIVNDLKPAMGPGDPTTVKTLSRLTDTTCLGTMRFKEPLSIEVVEKLLRRAVGLTVP
ncbi:MAG TPA: dethiobiotin synthase [Candidatus Binataceae bacterium]|nr:dethiobiotin synthase [Candidatus Binataceae bacterium]